MRRSVQKPFYCKGDLLELVGLAPDKASYRRFRKLMSEEVVQKTGYDQKHTFTEVEKDIIVKYFKN